MGVLCSFGFHFLSVVGVVFLGGLAADIEEMGVEMLRFPSALLGFLPFLLIGMFREGDGGLEVF